MKSSLVKLGGMIGIGMALAACGGGGGGGSDNTPSTVATTAEGLYDGTTNTGRTISGLVFDDGTYYLLYGVVNDPTLVAGAVQGNGTSNNGSFSSTNAKDINLEGAGITDLTVSASYVQKQSFNGSFTFNNQVATFALRYNTDYELTPTLAALAGTYTGGAGSPAGTENATLTVTTGGAISGTGASGCSITGTVTPRSKGNAFNTSITFGGAPCLAPNTTVTGLIYFHAASKRAYAVALTAARTNGVIFVGEKP